MMSYPEKIPVDGIIDRDGRITYIGDAMYSHGDGFYRCLARVDETLCIVEVRIKLGETIPQLDNASVARPIITPSNQSRIAIWVRSTFGDAVATDVPERALRVAEEALELTQACGLDAATLHRLVDYVFARPVGEVEQEIAGCMVTIYSAASTLGIDADAVLEAELARIHRPEIIERCRRRQVEKRAALVATSERECACSRPSTCESGWCGTICGFSPM